ncbi:MAG: hypothetical protein FWD01_00155, partial [Defluviitaleaceae bacterium]|nr:hypothetical protein [Defluviitaleaceae bacterium]
MKKNLYAILILVIISVLGLFMLAACNTDDTGEEAGFSRYFENRELFQGETLTISTFYPLTNIRYSSLGSLAARYMNQNPGINIEVSQFDSWSPESMLRYQEILSVQLLAGTAPDLIDISWNIFPWTDSRTNRMFADWFPIMHQDPNFDENDFYMNALNSIASRADGRLVIYPLAFSYNLLFANNTVPGMSEFMTGRNYITITDLHQAYHDFAADTHFSLMPDYSVLIAVISRIDDYIDIENRTANFNNQEFIQFINETRDITANQNPTPPASGFWGGSLSRQEQAERSELFLFDSGNILAHHQLINFEEDLPFGNALAMVNSKGELSIMAEFAFALNAAAAPAQQALAWDFMKFIQDPEADQPAPPTRPFVAMPGIPVYRPFLPVAVDYWMNHHHAGIQLFANENGFRIVGGMEQAMADVAAILDEISNMPMSVNWV